MFRFIFFSGTHIAMLLVGFALGVYFLPILTEPKGPPAAMLAEESGKAQYSVELSRDLKGNDFLHWGEGTISVSDSKIVHTGKLAPGPDYKLYLTTEFVEDEAGFEAIKSSALRVGDVKTFQGFILDVPEGVDVNQYNTVLVWCEAFGEFITAGQYR